jgi:hypothetical protein
MTIPPAAPELTPVEARSGLDPWVRAELPIPPTPRGLGWVGTVGPGVGASDAQSSRHAQGQAR